MTTKSDEAQGAPELPLAKPLVLDSGGSATSLKYQEVATKLNANLQRLNELDARVLERVAKTWDHSKEGKRHINEQIDIMTNMAWAVPADGKDENLHIIHYMNDAVGSSDGKSGLIGKMNGLFDKIAKTAEGIRDNTVPNNNPNAANGPSAEDILKAKAKEEEDRKAKEVADRKKFEEDMQKYAKSIEDRSKAGSDELKRELGEWTKGIAASQQNSDNNFKKALEQLRPIQNTNNPNSNQNPNGNQRNNENDGKNDGKSGLDDRILGAITNATKAFQDARQDARDPRYQQQLSSAEIADLVRRSQPPQQSQPSIPQAPSIPQSTGGGGGGMPNIGDSLGQMLQQRALADAMKGKEGGQGVERPSAPSAAQGGGTPPAPAKPATTAPPTTSTPPTSTAPVPPEAGGKPQGKEGPPAEQGTQPARTAGPDGMVEYAFPGGRGTQRVPIPVADALDKAFANKAGTDARAAYQGTPASWTDDKQIGSRTDPAELRTGAVVVGERGAALLAVFGAEGGGTLEAIIDGELTPFTEEVQQQSQQLGPFVGFFLPNGIDFESADVELTPGLVGPASVVA